jgi:hypothetical protein
LHDSQPGLFDTPVFPDYSQYIMVFGGVQQVVGGYWASQFTTAVCNGATNTGIIQ